MKIIISDTTALIILAKCNYMNLLSTFVEKVYIPSGVMKELSKKNDGVQFIIEKTDFIEIKNVSDENILNEVKKSNLDMGEIEAISLALETGLDLIIDEKSGRKYAESKGIEIIGLLGVLRINLANKNITYVELLYIFEEFKKVKFRVSPKLEKIFLEDMLNLKNILNNK